MTSGDGRPADRPGSVRRTAVVTGAGQGIGLAVARALLDDGFRVLMMDRAEGVLAAATRLSERASGIVCDVTSSSSIDQAFRRIDGELDRIDVLVNNAGITSDSPIQDMTEPQWDAVVDVNLKGAFLMTRASVARMGPGSSIVNFSSIASLGGPNQANYSAAKAGVRGMTRALAKELGPQGIRVNAVAPGFIVSDMSDSAAERLGIPIADFQARAAAETPLRRVGTADDVASAVRFLCGDGAGFITGQTLFVDGGWVL